MTVGGMASGPEGLETFKQRNAWPIFLVLIQGRKRGLKKRRNLEM